MSRSLTLPDFGAIPVPAATTRLPGAGRRVWMLLDDVPQAARLDTELSAQGWQVECRLDGMGRLFAQLDEGAPMPDVLLCGLRYFDGDAFRLIRKLAALPQRPVLYFTSRQQRAVIRSAVVMAEACGMQVAGFAEKPVEAKRIAADLGGLQPRSAGSAQPAPEPLREGELRALLDEGRLQAWVQPQMRIEQREVVGFESLMRGLAGDGTILSPERLLPALARHGLLEEATLAVARQVAGFVAGCLREGLPVSGAINVSLRSLSDAGFCHALSRLVGDAGLDPGWITLEIAESDTMVALPLLIENASRIRLLGFRLAIDHFGTGHSSLARLSQIPVSELKIERSLISRLASDPAQQRIVAACVHLGASMGLRIVAEGVETPAQLQAVQAAGCAEMQGFLLAAPMPMDKARSWLRSLDEMRAPF